MRILKLIPRGRTACSCCSPDGCHGHPDCKHRLAVAGYRDQSEDDITDHQPIDLRTMSEQDAARGLGLMST